MNTRDSDVHKSLFYYFSRYRSVVKDLWWRHFMSILVSTFQITGCILYCGGEAYDGFKHVPLVSQSVHKPDFQ